MEDAKDEKNGDQKRTSDVESHGETLLEGKPKIATDGIGEGEDELEGWKEISQSEGLKRFRNLLRVTGLAAITVISYVGTNVKLVLDYSEAAENNRYVRMTLAYMIAPIFITSLINLAWYIDDDLQAKDKQEKATPRKTWWLRGILLSLQMGTVLRYVQALIYGYKSKQSEGREKVRYTRKMVILERDATLLRSFTSFMQGVPQYALQFYILTEGSEKLLKDGALWQILSMAGSIWAISWGAVSCDRVLGSASPKDTLSDLWAIALLVPWRLFSVVSRMTILALFSTLFPIYFGLGCVAHYLVMYGLIQRQKVATHNGTRGEVFLFLVGGLVFIVTDLLVRYERGYHKYIVYYTITFVEGAAMMAVWYVYTDIDLHYRRIIIIGVSVSFFMGIIFLRLFYEYTHPQRRKCCFSSCCQPRGKLAMET